MATSYVYMKDSTEVKVSEQLMRLPEEAPFTEGDAATKEHMSPKSRNFSTLLGQALQGLGKFLKVLPKKTWKVASEDPRRLIHSAKVGLALAAVSVLILLKKPYNSIGQNAIWAVLTVVVIFEFTAGATLSKGWNRTLGTLIAGFLGLGVSYLAKCGGQVGEPVIVGVAIFIAGAAATFVRFFSRIKSRYDYGVIIFLLTFCLIVVGGFRVQDALRIAKDRFLIICIGSGIALTICLFIYPIWAGDDLHNMISEKFQRIADIIEACVTAYCQEQSKAQPWTSKFSIEDDPIYQQFRVLLLSSHTEESLANFAHWEPPHGCFKPKYPWRTYVKMGVALRYCAYSVMALHSCLRSDIQASQKLRSIFQENITCVGKEAAQVLRKLGHSVRSMQRRKNEDIMALVTKGVEDLQKSMDLHFKILIDAQRWTTEEGVQSKLGVEKTSHRASHVLDAPGIVFDDYRYKKCCPELTLAETTIEDEACKAHASVPQVKVSPPYRKNFRSSFTTSQKTIESASAVSLVTFISLLVDTVARLEYVIDVADELADHACFKNPKEKHEGVDTVHRLRDTASLHKLDDNNQAGEA